MPVKVTVLQVNGRRIHKLKEELGYLDTGSFIRTLPLSTERQDVEDELERLSPKDGHKSDTHQWMIDHGTLPDLPKFAKGWRVKRLTEANRLVWNISHVLESSFLKGAKVKFKSIELGTKDSTWTVKRKYYFKDYGIWAKLIEGQKIRHPASEGADVIGKISEYIQTTMIPKIRSKTDDIVKRRLARV